MWRGGGGTGEEEVTARRGEAAAEGTAELNVVSEEAMAVLGRCVEAAGIEGRRGEARTAEATADEDAAEAPRGGEWHAEIDEAAAEGNASSDDA